MHHGQSVFRKGFALPTVLIASVVLLSILAVSVSATTAIRTTLKNQYYAQLAQIAGEAGVAYAKACLAANGNVPQWTNAKPLTPATDCSGNVLLTPTVQTLIVAGGGGGGSRHGGGGGAGGVIHDLDTTIAVGTYPVVVGSGGNGTANGNGAQNSATNGGNSSVFGLVAIGGGAGRGDSAGAAGGSGGGGGPGSGGGSATAGQGNAGAVGVFSTYYMGGGGGGAGGAGVSPSYPSNIEPAGGPGVSNSITGSSVTYAAGGRGGSYNVNTAGIAGAANTGNGGGGAGGETNGGGAGGSGVVVISYPTASGITATGGTITTVGLHKIHRFTGNANFVVTAVGTATCPTAPRCSVSVNGNVRSSFSVGIPTLDADGKALTIPYSGYVELTRSSNGAVWRTITQPSAQQAVVPDLCSGAATSALGWNNAVKAATQDTFAPTPSAQSITLANTSLNGGYIFFRKDFTVTKDGTYNINALTPTTSDAVDVFIDGAKVVTSIGSLSTVSRNLTAGCHTITAKLTNATIVPRTTRFTASVQEDNNVIPAVTTDSSWRVTAGDTKHYSMEDYYTNTFLWTPVRVFSSAGWAENYSAMSISTTHSYDGSGNYPSSSYAYFRDNRTITVSSATEARVAILCDDACVVYLDGEQIILTGNLTNRSYVDVTLQPGEHKFGVRLQNGGGPSSFYFSAFKKSDNSVLSQSDANWVAANVWTTSQEFYSYDNAYVPSPATTMPTANARVLVVGGGGGGGGNHGGGGGGGGVAYNNTVSLSPQAYTVTVGAGGSGGIGSSGTAGGLGGTSVFGGLIYAIGGGGGGGRITTNSVSRALVGGSGGGGAGTIDAATGIAGAGTWGFIGQGNRGGNGSSDATAGQGGGGGGATSAGGNATGAANTGVSGAGGAGYTTSISGSSVCYAGGGSGGRWGNIANGIGAPGCGAGAGTAGGPITGGAGTANTGGGGGGGSDGAGNGGAGGSGVVIISYRTGTMTATGGTITTSGGYTIHRFTSSGTFTVTGIPQPATLGINVAPPFSEWTLSGGATYNSGTGEVTLPSNTAVVSSPPIRVNTLGVMYLGADFNPPTAAVNWTPLGGFYTQANYFAIDGVTPVTNSAGQTANGCAKSLPLNVFTTNTTQCGFNGGANLKYVNFSFNGGDWASPGIKIRNPSIIFN